MKYSIALLIGAVSNVSADSGCDCFDCGQASAYDYNPNILDRNIGDVENMTGRPDNNLLGNNANNIQYSAAVQGLEEMATSFLEQDFHGADATFDAEAELGDQFFDDDHNQDKILCIGNDDLHDNSNKLIDEDAGKVLANWESCHRGEVIIPALKEETTVQQAASYSQDSGSSYKLKGVASNNWKICGSMTENQSEMIQGCNKRVETLSQAGAEQSKYCQNGDKLLSGCCEHRGSESKICDVGLNGALLDGEAAEVTSDPSKTVDEQINKVIRKTISDVISQAIQFSLDKALDDMVKF